MKKYLLNTCILSLFVGDAISGSLIDKAFSRNNIEELHQGKHQIVFTFDDGPTPGVTEKILDTLKKNNVTATFFVIGSKAAASPQLMQRLADEGHIVANHTMNHPKKSEYGRFSWKKKIKAEILGSHTVLAPYMTNSKRWYFRAPEAVWADKFANLLNHDIIGNQYFGPLLWDIGGEMKKIGDRYVEAADWACWRKEAPVTVEECLDGYLTEIKKRDGGVVLMHDLRKKSADMLELMIPALMDQGFDFKTMDDVELKN